MLPHKLNGVYLLWLTIFYKGWGEGYLSFWKIEDGVFKCEGLKNSENHNSEDKRSEDG